MFPFCLSTTFHCFFYLALTASSPLNTSSPKQLIRYRRTATSTEAVLLYSTADSIYELPFKSMGKEISATDFRKILSDSKSTISAFSATYQTGDNLLLYGSKQLYYRPIRSGKSYLTGDDQQLPFNIDGTFTVDWVDFNVYSVHQKAIIMSSLTTQHKKVVHNISGSARNLLVDQEKHFIAWIANDINIVRMNKDGSGEKTIWTETFRTILCMTFDSDRGRFYFFVNDQKSQLDPETQQAKAAIFYSIDANAEESPLREGLLQYPNARKKRGRILASGGAVLHVVKYYEQTFAILRVVDKVGNEVYQLCLLRKSGSQMVEGIVSSTSRPITGLSLAWMYTNPPRECHRDKSRCSYLCAHLHNDKTPMCLCQEGASASCKAYLMTEKPPPTRAPVTTPGSSNIWGPAQNVAGWKNEALWNWLITGAFVLLACIALYLVYMYFVDEENAGEMVEREGTWNEEEEMPPASGLTTTSSRVSLSVSKSTTRSSTRGGNSKKMKQKRKKKQKKGSEEQSGVKSLSSKGTGKKKKTREKSRDDGKSEKKQSKKNKQKAKSSIHKKTPFVFEYFASSEQTPIGEAEEEQLKKAAKRSKRS